MNDQLMDASNKGLLIDLMQYWLAMPAWWISRMLILLHEACAVVLGVVMAGAVPNNTVGFSGWVGPLTSALMGNWYSRALAIGMLGLGLTLMLMGSGFRLKLVQPRAFVRWTLIMLLLAIAAPTLYATTIQLVTQVPALVMPPIVETLPPITASWITVGQDGEAVQPFDPANEAYAARAAVLAVPTTASGCATTVTSSAVCAHPMYTPMDAVLALWRTDRASLISGVDGVSQSTPDGTITVQFDGVPPDFAAMFYPDATQPWYGGAFTSDPNGMQKRREVLTIASSGTLHAVVGVLAALATLMPTLAQALMTVCGGLLFLLGIVVAPLGMLGNQRQWVAVVYRSFFQISGWQTVLAVGTNLATYLLFGTPTQLGIAMAYPTMLVVLPLFVWVQWRVLRFAMGLSWQGFAAVRTVVSREPLQRLLSDQPAAATEARVTATGHYTATADPAATQPTMAPSTLLRTTPMQETTTPGSAAHATSAHASTALPSLINPRGMVMRMQQATHRTVQRVQQLDHQIEVKEAAMLRTAEVRTDTQLDRADQAITTMIGGKAIAAGVTYVHENEVTPEWLFAPTPTPTNTRPTASSPRAERPSSATTPVARRNGDRSRPSSAAPRPTDIPTQELPTRPLPRTARPPADLPPTQPLVASAGRSAMPPRATEATALDAPRESNTAHAAIASVAHTPTPAPASHVTASTPPPVPAHSTRIDVPTPPTQELPAAAPTVATPSARQQPAAQPVAPRTPELASNASRGPQRPPVSMPTNGTELVNSAAPSSDPVIAPSTPTAQPETPAPQATPAVATATRASMAEPAAPTVEARTPQATTRPARSRARSRVGMPAQQHPTAPIIDITNEVQPAPSDPSPPADVPAIPARSGQRGRR